MAITQLQEFPEARFGHVGPLLVSIWYSELSLRSIDALDTHQRMLAERYGKVTMISVVSSATKNVVLPRSVAEISGFVRVCGVVYRLPCESKYIFSLPPGEVYDRPPGK